jgi:GH43 family beta-xylosidase
MGNQRFRSRRFVGALACAAVLVGGLAAVQQAQASPVSRSQASAVSAQVRLHKSGLGGNGNPTTVNSFAAPLVNGYGADPSMVYDSQDGYYYLIYNRDDVQEKVMVRARSLAGLLTAPKTVVWAASDTYGTTGLGGGYLKQYGDNWFLYIEGSNVGNMVLESAGDSPLGPYSVKAEFPGGPGPHDSGYAFQSIEIDGQYYGFETSNGEGTAANSIYITTMSNPWTITGTWNLIASPGSNPFGSGWDCGGNVCIDEGSSIAVHDGKVFDIFSAGKYASPDYCVGMIWADLSSDLTDPSSWTNMNQCVFQRNDAAGVYGPGSMTFFNAPDGSLWVVYHVKTTTADNWLGNDRRLEAQEVTWDANGMPDFGQPYALGSYQDLPGGDPGQQVWEANQAILQQVSVQQSATAVGGSYVTGMDQPGSSVAFKVDEASAGTYRFNVEYASGAVGPVSQDVYVNGSLQTTLAYSPTGSSSDFQSADYVPLDVKLTAGSNTVEFRPDGAFGTQAAQLSLDQLLPVVYDGSQDAAQAQFVDSTLLPANTATGLLSDSGINVPTGFYVGGINYPDSSVTFSVIVPTPGTYDMQVYYDNGGSAASTLNMSVNGGSSTQPSFPVTGKWGDFGPDQYVTVPVSLNAGENTVEFSTGTNYAELDRIYVPDSPG